MKLRIEDKGQLKEEENGRSKKEKRKRSRRRRTRRDAAINLAGACLYGAAEGNFAFF